MAIRITRVDGQLDPAVEAFIERTWDEWHAEQGHDPNVSWDTMQVDYVAYSDDGEPIGYANGRISAGVGHLSELIVATVKRRSGVGSQLLAEFTQLCQDQGCHKMVLHTDEEGPQRAFYAHHGWHLEAKLPRDRGGRDFVRLARFLVAPNEE